MSPPTYEVRFTKGAEKDLSAIPPKDQRSILRTASALSSTPRPRGCEKMKGQLAGYYRVRVGNFRIVYVIDDASRIVTVTKVGHRQGVYD